MLPHLSLRSTTSRHIVRVTLDAYSRGSRSPLPLPQPLSQTRGLRITPRNNEAPFGRLFANLLRSLSPPEPTVEPEQAALELGTLALAAQDSRKRSPTITTLSPERLTPADVIHLQRGTQTFTICFKPLLELSSNIAAATPSTKATTTSESVQRLSSNGERQPRVPHEVTLRSASGASDLEGVQFPAGRGCLYYHSPPAPCTPLAGALRLRTLPSLGGDPKAWTCQSVRDAFERGHDFCVLPDIPWHIPVLSLTATAGYDAVRAMLLYERLVAPSVMRDAEREGRRWSLKRHGSRVIHRFGQPFVVDLGTKRYRFYFVGRRRVYTHDLWDLCSWNKLPGTESEAHQPFTGKLICAFERSTYPAHVGRLFVTIRVRKVLSPVRRNPRYSGPQDIPLPRADSLLARGIRQRALHRSSDTHKGKRQWTLWLANVKTVFRGMHVLFENDSKGMVGGKPRRG